MSDSGLPTIKTTPRAEEYIRAVVDACEGEVGGWGYAYRDDDGDYVIYRFVVLPQEASSGGVDFDDEGQHIELARAAEAEELDYLRVSWHSHGKMSTFYSNTDEEAIKQYKASGVPFLISLIYNRDGDVKPRLDLFDSQVVSHITFNDVDYKVMPDERNREVIEAAKEHVKERVRTRTYSWNKGKGKGKGSSSDNNRPGRSRDSRWSTVDDDDLAESRQLMQRNGDSRPDSDATSPFYGMDLREMSDEQFEELCEYWGITDVSKPVDSDYEIEGVEDSAGNKGELNADTAGTKIITPTDAEEGDDS